MCRLAEVSMWDWIKKAGQKALEIGAGYLDNKAFINSLLNMSSEQAEEELQNKLQSMDSVAYSGFMLTLATMCQGVKQDIRRLAASQDANRSWGNSFEDQYAQFMVEASSGFHTQKSPDLQQAELRLQGLEAISDRASQIYQSKHPKQISSNVEDTFQAELPEGIKSQIPAENQVVIVQEKSVEHFVRLTTEENSGNEQDPNDQAFQEEYLEKLQKLLELADQAQEIVKARLSNQISDSDEGFTALYIPTPDELIQAIKSRNTEEQQRIIGKVIRVFRSRNLAAQQQLIEQCPQFTEKERVLQVITFNNQASHVSALGAIAIAYSSSNSSELGVVFGKAGYSLAIQYFGYPEPMLSEEILFTGASQTATACLTSLYSLGMYQQLLDFGEEALAWLEQETPAVIKVKIENYIDTLRIRLIEANIRLKRYEQAQAQVKAQEALLQARSTQLTLDNQLRFDNSKSLLDDLIVGPDRLHSEQKKKDKSPEDSFAEASEQLNDILKMGLNSVDKFPYTTKLLSPFLTNIPEIIELIEQQKETTLANSDLSSSESSGIASIEVGNRMADVLANLGLLTEIDQVKREIRTASGIFLDPTKKYDPELVENSLSVLMRAKDWAERNQHVEQKCEALWGIAFCYMSKARIEEVNDVKKGYREKSVEALQELRNNIEQIRQQITDPFKRVYWLNKYENLFPILCWQLYELDRPLDLLDAIEGAKGRVLADVLTRRENHPVPDQDFSLAIRQLPTLIQQLKAHYLTFLVADEETYAVLVAKDGSLHTHSVPVGKIHLKEWLEHDKEEYNPIDPKNWNKRKHLGSSRLGNLPERLEPLISWLSPLVEIGLLQKDDHLCYCPDESLHLIPLHYLPLLGQPVVKFFSISRIHGAAALMAILDPKNENRTNKRPTQFTAVYVSSKTDHKHPKAAEQKLEDLRWISEWLEETKKVPGRVVAEEKADLQTVTQLPFSQRLVHFAMHGTFPNKDEQGEINPYRSSGLLLARNGQLPDDPNGQNEALFIEQGSELNEALLTPKAVIERKLNFEGSHVTMQACVSGRAKEGIGGDAIGLEWAILLARASSLLSTHWMVHSGCTRLFSQKFYQRWLFEGDTRANAWRKTVLDLMDSQEASDLYDWAAFSLSGDWR
jgi:CHAT domain-containing protein